MTNTKINYLDDFDPAEYLNDYFVVEPEIEDVVIARFTLKSLQNMLSNMLVLNFGSGPTIYNEVALAPQSREIHMCDYLPANLEALRDWLDDTPKAFNWEPYIKLILNEAGESTTHESVLQRVAEIRRKVTRLIQCDALSRNPLGKENSTQYDLVVTQFVTENLVSNLTEWIQVLCNISTLVLPGGWLLIGVLTNTQGYLVGEKFFPCIDLSDEDIRQGYIEAGYDPSSFDLEKVVTSGKQGYSGLTCAVARKFSHVSKK
ncbi:guanitoxin biosynthesis pre-guanitoxin forming N-methyltransferase GntF [Anaerolineales bacterium HSG6]|nr:guanitoxin biosynthesis pre-guanitoxin forming N-methyltransferase GntF [Anaerolineales bacterium HSG6]